MEVVIVLNKKWNKKQAGFVLVDALIGLMITAGGLCLICVNQQILNKVKQQNYDNYQVSQKVLNESKYQVLKAEREHKILQRVGNSGVSFDIEKIE